MKELFLSLFHYLEKSKVDVLLEVPLPGALHLLQGPPATEQCFFFSPLLPEFGYINKEATPLCSTNRVYCQQQQIGTSGKD